MHVLRVAYDIIGQHHYSTYSKLNVYVNETLYESAVQRKKSSSSIVRANRHVADAKTAKLRRVRCLFASSPQCCKGFTNIILYNAKDGYSFVACLAAKLPHVNYT